MIGKGVHYWGERLKIPYTYCYGPILTGTRPDILGLLSDVKELALKRKSLASGIFAKGVFEIDMPCGCSRIFKEETDIPRSDLYCQCGKGLMIKVLQ